MSKKLLDYIDEAERYKKEFSTWEAMEQIIDDDKAFWMLRKPGSQYRKVCLYRDGCNMFVYGDYGKFTFDSMTWTGSVYNLEYDNIGCQIEKLDIDSRKTIEIYDEDKCREDIIIWLKEKLKNYYNLNSNEIEKVVNFIEADPIDFEIEDFCNNQNSFFDVEDIITFAIDALYNTDKYEWILFLKNNWERIYDFENDSYENELWNAGKCIHQKYFICMYALQICGGKLKKQKEKI